jgi:hypothetical protein
MTSPRKPVLAERLQSKRFWSARLKPGLAIDDLTQPESSGCSLNLRTIAYYAPSLTPSSTPSRKMSSQTAAFLSLLRADGGKTRRQNALPAHGAANRAEQVAPVEDLAQLS